MRKIIIWRNFFDFVRIDIDYAKRKLIKFFANYKQLIKHPR